MNNQEAITAATHALTQGDLSAFFEYVSDNVLVDKTFEENG
jgi:hypothetical protein